MAHGSESASEPVLVALTVPARRSLVEGLVRTPRAEVPVPVLDADAPDAEIAEFLAGIVHTDSGFVARTGSGDRALAIIAATAAALCGEDIPAALAHPDLPFLTGLKPPAVEALRAVLLAIESDDPDTLTAALTPLATS